MNITNYKIVPTGFVIKEYLEEYGISQKQLSERISTSEKHISNLLSGKSRLTEEMAIKLENIFHDVPASYWLNYEAKYREQVARAEISKKMNSISLKEIAEKYHFKEVYKGLKMSLEDQANDMLHLLGVSDYDAAEKVCNEMSYNFMQDNGDKTSILIWLKLCEEQIKLQNNIPFGTVYNKKELCKELKTFKSIAMSDDIESITVQARELCNDLGINLVYQDAINNSKIRGAQTFVHHEPAIYLSGRFKSHDHIWFAFMHEIAHLILHQKNSETFITWDDEKENDLKEKEANDFARNFFIDPDRYNDYVDKLKESETKVTEEQIRAFAKQEGVLPGIVIGRLQHDHVIGYDEYNYLRRKY